MIYMYMYIIQYVSPTGEDAACHSADDTHTQAPGPGLGADVTLTWSWLWC